MSLTTYASFFLLILTMAYTPGPMTLFLMSNGMRTSLGKLYPILLGANNAYLLAIVIFSLGLTQLLQQHEYIFKAVQVAGIVYLLYLSLMQWRKKSLGVSETMSQEEYQRWRLYTKGALVAFSNPKALLIFTVVFPQFATQGDAYYWQIAILGITFLGLQFSSGCFYALLGYRIKNVILRPENQLLINKLSAFVLLVVAAFLIARL